MKKAFPKKIDDIEYLETTKNHCLFNFYIGDCKFRGKLFLNDDGENIEPKSKLGVFGYFYPLNNIFVYFKCLKNLKRVTQMLGMKLGNDLLRERRTNYTKSVDTSVELV